MPPLALYTRVRLEELGRASVGDVKQKDGIDDLEVTPLGDEGDAGTATS